MNDTNNTNTKTTAQWITGYHGLHGQLTILTLLNQTLREANLKLQKDLDSQLYHKQHETIIELQKEVHKWKSAHDNQVNLKRILMDRPDLKDRAKRMQELLARIEFLESSRDSLLNSGKLTLIKPTT